MGHLDYEQDELAVKNVDDGSVVSNAVAPEPCEVAGEGATPAAGVLKLGNLAQQPEAPRLTWTFL